MKTNRFYTSVCPYPNRFWLLLGLLALLSLGGCRWEGVPDCIQGAGPLVVREFELEPFDQITVFEGVRLVLRSGNRQEVSLQAPDNLLNDISAAVEGGRLILRNHNNCNFFRDYGQVVFTVTSPDIIEVRSFTGFPVESEGVLDWTRLSLLSEGFIVSDSETTDGSFELDLDVEEVRIVANGNSYFELRGNCGFLDITIAAGLARVDALELEAERVRVFHRGSQDVLVNPLIRIEGIINGYGDVIAVSRPPEVEVEEAFNGRLRFLTD